MSRSDYGRGARLLSLGLASTGVVTFAYFAVASHVLGDVEYKRISLLWSVLFVVVSVLYKPIEQLLSRTIADRRARGLHDGHPLRTPLVLQGAFAAAFAVLALAFREPLTDDVLGGSDALYGVLVAATLCYAASYFARGWLAGHQWFGLYGGLVFLESSSRLVFALVVAVGIAEGQTAVALGIAVAPLVSLLVVPLAFRTRPARGARAAGEEALGLARGGTFALAVLVIMAAEQALINAAVITADITADDPAVAGFVFNALLIARAPLLLFQAIQGSLLPHLAGLATDPGRDAEFRRAVRVTVRAVVAFAGAVAAGLLVAGPWAMDVLFGSDTDYGRWGLALVAAGMGAHLIAGTLNQAALARDHHAAAAACWLAAATLFVAWMLAGVIEAELLRAEVGYAGATTLLCGLLAGVYRRG